MRACSIGVSVALRVMRFVVVMTDDSSSVWCYGSCSDRAATIEREHVKELQTLGTCRLGALAAPLCALARLQSEALASRNTAPRTATAAIVTTPEFRVAVVATRLMGDSPPTGDVRLGFARNVGSSWREFDERRLGQRCFWNAVSRPQAICRLEIASVATRRSPGVR
jgi:hypothetical protein